MIGFFGPIDLEMLLKGQETHKYFTKEYDLFYINEVGFRFPWEMLSHNVLFHPKKIVSSIAGNWSNGIYHPWRVFLGGSSASFRPGVHWFPYKLAWDQSRKTTNCKGSPRTSMAFAVVWLTIVIKKFWKVIHYSSNKLKKSNKKRAKEEKEKKNWFLVLLFTYMIHVYMHGGSCICIFVLLLSIDWALLFFFFFFCKFMERKSRIVWNLYRFCDREMKILAFALLFWVLTKEANFVFRWYKDIREIKSLPFQN